MRTRPCYNRFPVVAILTLLPIIILAVGAALSRSLPARFALSGRRIGAAAAALATAACGALLWAAEHTPDGRLRLVLSRWGEAFQGAPTLDVDLLAGSFLLLISGLAWLAIASRPSGERRGVDGLLWIAAAAALFVAAGSTPLGIIFGWLALDLAIYVAVGGGRRPLIAGQLGLLLALVGLAGLRQMPGGLSGVTPVGLSPTVGFWLVAAGVIRTGLYPVWWAVPRSSGDRLWAAPAVRLAPTLAGLFLIVRVTGLTPSGQGLSTTALLPALVATLLGAILAWLADDRATALDWQTSHHAGLVFMAATFGGQFGMYLALVLGLDLVLSRSVQYCTAAQTAGRWGRAIRWPVGASLVGLPPTLGFVGRWLLYRELLDNQLTGVLIVTLVAATLVSASLLATPAEDRNGYTPRLGVAAATAVLAILPVVVGVGFEVLQPALHALAGFDVLSPWADIVATIRNPLAAERGLVLLAGILVPPAAGTMVTWWRRGKRTAASEAGRRGLRHALDLTSAGHVLTRAVAHIGAITQLTSGRSTSRQDMAWTLVAVVAILTAVLAASPGSGTPSPAPTPLAAVFLIGAVVVAASVLLSAAPAVNLAALAVGYILSAALLALLHTADVAAMGPGAALGAPAIVATIKLLSGLLVVGILAIGVLQAPLDRRLASAARRLRRSRSPEDSGSEQLLPALSLAIAVVIAYGIRSTNLPPQLLPDALLQPALVLIAGGVLAVVFARHALHLAGGVLLALMGFELVYSRLDPGLLITGGLASFQLLFAVVASHFVGPAVPPELRPGG